MTDPRQFADDVRGEPVVEGAVKWPFVPDDFCGECGASLDAEGWHQIENTECSRSQEEQS